MLVRITKRVVESTRPGSKDEMYWDTELKGFGLKVTPAANRVWLIQYWSPTTDRTRRRFTLGRYPALTVPKARIMAGKKLQLIREGRDPFLEAAEVKRTGKDETLIPVSAEYLAESRAKMKPRTADEYARLFKVYILPTLGKRAVSQITLRDVAALHMAHRAQPYQANRILQLMAAFLNWCESRGYRVRNSNPCIGVEPFPEEARERFLSVAEIGKLGAALATAERVGLPPAPAHAKKPRSDVTAKHRPKTADTPIPASASAVNAIRFLLLTGWRKQEALTLRWSDVDLVRGAATLPNTKTGKSFRPLGAAAVALLATLSHDPGEPYVFPSPTPGEPLRDVRRVWSAARHAAGLDDVRLHDLRHTVASFAVGEGYSLFIVGKLLGHADTASTARYSHLADDARIAAATSVSGALSAALDGRETAVTPLRKTQ